MKIEISKELDCIYIECTVYAAVHKNVYKVLRWIHRELFSIVTINYAS